MDKNLYDILGVSKSATDAEIKSAYRNLAKKYHPDLYSTKPEAEKKAAEEKFKEINKAYEVLSDATKKDNYDRFGTTDTNMGGGAGGWQQWSGGGFDDIINDIFSGFTGGARSNRGAVDGEDITVKLTLTFEEAAFGCEKKVQINRTEKCPDCGGVGAKDQSAVKTCSYCHGTGNVTTVQQTIFGASRVSRACPECGGTGKIILDKCKTCKGTGSVKKQREVNVNVPAGVDSGQVMNYRGEGNVGKRGGARGNLVVVLDVKPHKYFERRGSDLYLELPIDFFEAAVGAKIVIPTLKDKVKLTIPEGTQTGETFRLKGYGIKNLKRESHGDMYVTVIVDTPKNLNKKQIELLKGFSQSLDATQYVNKFRFNRNTQSKD